jgi:2-polyprenyl-6-methoxyphenol hydroxylase-like FAD-dependent oxidoreductase
VDQEVRYGSEMRILIVGAGVAGLSLAAHLRQRGFVPEVIHAEGSSRPGPRGSEAALIASPAAGVLIGRGCFRELLEHAAPMDALRILDASGNEIRTIDLARHFERFGGGYVATRARLHSSLAEHAGPIREGVRTDRIDQGERAVSVDLSDPEGDQRRALPVRLGRASSAPI